MELKTDQRFMESIKLLDGEFHSLEYHQARIDRTLDQFQGGEAMISLDAHLRSLEFPKKGLYKCRLIYSHQVEQIEFAAYLPKTIRSLKVVKSDINYSFKFADRNELDHAYAQRNNCDDIIIVRDGFVTDSYNANILFLDGERWLTPGTPLLRGTMRQRLLDQSLISESRITIDDIPSFSRVKLVNAMVGFNGPEIDVSEIVF